MANKTLGLITVTTAGTPVRVTATRTLAQSYMVQQAEANTGKGYVGNLATISLVTGAGLLAVIPKNTTSTIAAFTSSSSSRLDPFDLSELWIDAEVSGEKFLMSYLPDF